MGSTFLAGLTAAASVAYLYSLRKLLAGRDAERLLVDDESADQQRGGDDDEDDEDFRSATETVYANQVWSLTQLYSVDFSQSRIGVKKRVFIKRAIKVCVSCC